MTNQPSTLTDMIALMEGNIAEARTELATSPTGYAFHTADCTLALGVVENLFRLVSPLSPQVHLEHDHDVAKATVRKWNAALNPAQRKAGCTLVMAAYVDVLETYIITQEKLLTLLRTAVK